MYNQPTYLMNQFVKALLSLIIVFVILGLTGPITAQEQDSPLIGLSAAAGFDGLYKSDYWVPVFITVSNEGPSINGSIQIAAAGQFNADEVLYSNPVSLPTQSSKRLVQYVYLSDLANTLTIELVDDRERILKSTETNNLDWLATDDILYGIVSSGPSDLDFLEELTGDRDNAAVAFVDIEALPEVPASWNAFDVLVFHDVDTGQLEPEQIEALLGWISTGGQMVVAGGPGWQNTVAGLDDLLPVTISGIESMADLPGLRTWAGQPFRDSGPFLVTIASIRDGEVLLQEDGLPLLSKSNFGRGSIYFMALDPNLAPLSDWDGSEVIWNEIVSRIPPLPAWAIGAKNGYAAKSAISSLPSLRLPSAGLLFLFIFIYIVTIGPLNYLVLKRIGRRELAWFTIPGLALAFTLVALLTGFRLKGNDVVVNQMSIAFGPIDGHQLRVQTLLGLYSPGRSTYDLTLPRSVVIRPFDDTFNTLSGGGNIAAVERNGQVEVQGIRVDVGDIQPLVADSYQKSTEINGNAHLRSEGDDFTLEVTVENNSPIPLTNATVLVGLNAIPLGDIGPGDAVNISEPFSTALSSSFGGGYSTSLIPPGPATSPIGLNYNVILGTSNYFDDPEVFPKWQLLEAIATGFSRMGSTGLPGTVTLIAWSDEEQLDFTLSKAEFEETATTLYFLEMPLEQTISSSRRFSIPKALMSWQVLGESGVFDVTINDLYLPTGWIEFEYRPWPEFRGMLVDQLDIILSQSEGLGSQDLPNIQLWDWQKESWELLEEVHWGQITVEDLEFYVGPGNAVRIRLQNDGSEALNITEVYPSLTGEIEAFD